MDTTWAPHEAHGQLSTKQHNDLPDSAFAFPKQRKEPLVDAEHVRNALARFDQVEGVSDSERDLAFANIGKAAKHYGVRVDESDWHDLGKKPHTSDSSR
jgi:hypothetical protein